MAFGHHEIRHFQLTGAGGRADDHPGKQGAKDHVHVVFGGEFLHQFRAAFRVGAVVFGDDFNRVAIDAAGVVDDFDGGSRRWVVPVALSRTNAGAVDLKADFCKCRALRLGVGHEPRQGGDGTGGTEALQDRAAGGFGGQDIWR